MKCFGVASSLILLFVSPALADLDKSAKKWVDEMRPLILPEEAKAYRGLKNNADAAEFQKIFWARRDPDLDTPENEYQAEYLKAVAEVDPKFRAAGRAGSQTDCGRVYILLGAPDSVKKEASAEVSFRTPETWTYKDRPTMKFKGGAMEIPLDGMCMFPEGNRFADAVEPHCRVQSGAVEPVVQIRLEGRFGQAGRSPSEAHAGAGSAEGAPYRLQDGRQVRVGDSVSGRGLGFRGRTRARRRLGPDRFGCGNAKGREDHCLGSLHRQDRTCAQVPGP